MARQVGDGIGQIGYGHMFNLQQKNQFGINKQSF